MDLHRKSIFAAQLREKLDALITPATVGTGARSVDDRRSGIQLTVELHRPADGLVSDRICAGRLAGRGPARRL